MFTLDRLVAVLIVVLCTKLFVLYGKYDYKVTFTLKPFLLSTPMIEKHEIKS